MNRLTRLVAMREIRESLRKKAIWVSLGVLLLASLALVILPEVLPDDSFERDLAITDAAPANVVEALLLAAQAIDLDLHLERVGGDDPLATATELVKGGDVDFALVYGGEGPRILQRTDDPDVTVSLIQRVLVEQATIDVYTRHDVDPDVLTELAAIETAPVDTVDTGRGGRQAAAFALTVVMYMVIMILASGVASSVATEKANRVAEVLLAVVPARSLLFGKVVGVGAVGFGTVAIAALPLLIKTMAGGDVPEALGTTLVSSIAWLAGGIVIYLLLAAMLGALADRTEDVGSVVAPLTISLVAIYLVSLGTTETVVGTVLSIVPISSPIAMPARIAIGAAAPWEIVASLACLVAGVVLVGRIAAGVYGRAIVRTGRRLKLSDVLRSATT